MVFGSCREFDKKASFCESSFGRNGEVSKMRGTKDEEKMLSPMFPRLHVNDTEKGGPKAPPRNKMALYEQLSVPSQKLSSGSPLMLPLHLNNGNSLVPSMSKSHGCAYERSAFIPFCNSPANSHGAEKLFSYCSGGGNINGDMASQNKKSMNGTNDQSVSITGTNDQSVSITLTSGTTPKFNLFQSPAFSNLKSVSCNEPGDENDLRVPIQSVAAPTCGRSWHQINQENLPHLNFSFSMPLQNVSDRDKKGTEITVLKEKDYRKNQNQDNAKASQIPNSLERSAPVPSVKGKTVANTLSMADTLFSPSGRVSLKETHSSSDREYRSIAAGVLKSLNITSSRINQESVTTQEKTILRDMECAGSRGKENASKLQGESYSRHSFGDDKRSPNEAQNVIESSEERKHDSSQIGHAERCDDVSETSMVDSIVAFTITPDDVVGVIGEKQFWKARRAIINQQRVFSIQVFELHRLIKVQKTIAGSPHLLHEDSLHVGKASLKSSPVKKLPSEYAIEPTPIIVKPKEQSQKPQSNTEFADENAVGGPPLPSANLEINKPLLAPRSNYEPHSGSSLPVPMAATNTKPTPWCFPAPGNQWLVPVMSPSEGLVYKPYSGPCPPTPGFMTSVYGSRGPMSLTPSNGDFLNAAYGVPASTPPLGQTYFPPYGMPVLNQSISGSSMEQMSPFTGPQSEDNQVSVGNMNLVFPHRSTSNMASQTSRVIPRCGGKFQASKESDVQGSTATSPAERIKGNALPLFPTEPTVQASDQSAQTNKEQTRVIKVVPHNPRSATESAAWIFRSIQEERKYYD